MDEPMATEHLQSDDSLANARGEYVLDAENLATDNMVGRVFYSTFQEASDLLYGVLDAYCNELVEMEQKKVIEVSELENKTNELIQLGTFLRSKREGFLRETGILTSHGTFGGNSKQ